MVADPLEHAFTDALAQLVAGDKPSRIAVAVSGGPDSMALALLTARCHANELVVLIADHGLRPESAMEAKQTQKWLLAHGIKSEILPLQLDAKKAAKQERARDARYHALTRYCHSHGIRHVLLGHHADDQAETFLLRLLAQSGPMGLAGMSARRDYDGILWLRPLLNQRKAELLDWLNAQQQPFISDPSNHNTDYTRVQLRQFLAGQPPASVTRLLALIQRFGIHRQQHEARIAELISRHIHTYPFAYATLDHAALELPDEWLADMLARLLCHISGKTQPPRREKLQRLITALRRDKKNHTIHGCLLSPAKNIWKCSPEAATQPPALPLAQALSHGRWGAYRIEGEAENPADYRIAALGPAGLAAIKRSIRPKAPFTPRILMTLPALWHLEAPILVPHIADGYQAAAKPDIAMRFAPLKPLADQGFCVLNTPSFNRKD